MGFGGCADFIFMGARIFLKAFPSKRGLFFTDPPPPSPPPHKGMGLLKIPVGGLPKGGGEGAGGWGAREAPLPRKEGTFSMKTLSCRLWGHLPPQLLAFFGKVKFYFNISAV